MDSVSQDVNRPATQRPRKSEHERFWKKVRVPRDPKACWVWTGAKRNKLGYGAFTRSDGTVVSPQHWLWRIVIGPIPAGMVLCHTCDNPPCISPLHLFIGTQRDNVRDCVAKGRHAAQNGHVPPGVRGEGNKMAKMNEQSVRELRRRRKAGGLVRDLASEFGISVAVVSQICLRRTWRHIPEED